MLVLSRRPGQGIQIGPDIEVVVISAEGGQVRLGIKAPRSITVLRRELIKQVVDENRRAVATASGPLFEQLYRAPTSDTSPDDAAAAS